MKHSLLMASALVALVAVAASGAGLPQLPADLCIADRTGDLIATPRLEPVGNPLVVSNSPETIRGLSGSAALYRTDLDSRHFRVFFHHLNASAPKLQIGVAITNPAGAPAPVELYMSYNSQMLPSECRSTVDYDPATAGWQAMRNWFVSRTRVGGDNYVQTLRPGQTRYIVQNVPYGATVTGMYDLGVRYAGPIGEVPTVKAAVVACDLLPPSPDTLPLAPPDTVQSYRRGVFAHDERWGQVECDVDAVRWLDLAGPCEGEFSNLLINEMEPASDDPRGSNPGNYGVVYSLNIALRNASANSVGVRCLLSAAGGAGFSGLMVANGYCEPGRLLRPYGSWNYNTVVVPPRSRKTFNIKFTLPGGSSGAHRLYFWPEADGS